MYYILRFIALFWQHSKPQQPIEQFNSIVPERLLFSITIDQSSDPTLYDCAVSSGMNIVEQKYGLTRFEGYKEAWVEYMNFCEANRKAIAREKHARYKI